MAENSSGCRGTAPVLRGLTALFCFGTPALFAALRLLQESVAAVVFCGYRVGVGLALGLLLSGMFAGRMFAGWLRRCGSLEAVLLALYFLLLWSDVYWALVIVATGFMGGVAMRILPESGRPRSVAAFAMMALPGYFLGAQWFLSPLITCVCALASGIVLVFLTITRYREWGVWRYALLLLLPPMFFMAADIAVYPCGRLNVDPAAVRDCTLRRSSTPLGRLYSFTDPDGDSMIMDVSGRMLKDSGNEVMLRRAVLPAALQFRREGLKVLYIGYTPSRIPALFHDLPHVSRIDVTSFSGNADGEIQHYFPAEWLDAHDMLYDLIFVSELPLADPVSRRVFINELKTRLRPGDGALVVPSQDIATGISVEYLPGTSKLMSIYSRGRVVTGWDQLEKNLRAINTALGADALIPGVLDELRRADSVQQETPRSRLPSVEFFRSVSPPSLWIRVLAVAAVAYLILRMLLSRYGLNYYFFAAAENGYSLALVLLSGIGMLSYYRLVNCRFAPAMLLLLALSMWQCRSIIWQRFFKSAYILSLAYLSLSQLYVSLNPEWVLLILLPAAAAGSGVIAEGIVQRAKLTRRVDALLMFGGGMAAALLFVWAEINDFDEALLYFALLLRVLYMIRF